MWNLLLLCNRLLACRRQQRNMKLWGDMNCLNLINNSIKCVRLSLLIKHSVVWIYGAEMWLIEAQRVSKQTTMIWFILLSWLSSPCGLVGVVDRLPIMSRDSFCGKHAADLQNRLTEKLAIIIGRSYMNNSVRVRPFSEVKVKARGLFFQLI